MTDQEKRIAELESALRRCFVREIAPPCNDGKPLGKDVDYPCSVCDRGNEGDMCTCFDLDFQSLEQHNDAIYEVLGENYNGA